MSDITTAASPRAAPRLRRPAEWRIIPALDRMPAAVGFAQSRLGGAAITAASALLLLPLTLFGPFLALAAAACAARPLQRRWIVGSCSLAFMLAQPNQRSQMEPQTMLAAGSSGTLVRLAALVLMLAVCVGVAALLRQYRATWPGRRPVVSVIAGYALLVAAVAQWQPQDGAARFAWAAIAIGGALLCHLCVVVRSGGEGVLASLCTMQPFWVTGSMLPYHGGAAQLRRVEAKNPEELAVTRLKGVKLLLWGWVMVIAFRLVASFDRSVLGVPELRDAVAAHIAGHPPPPLICWGALVCHYAENLLWLTGYGAIIIACARLAGFRLLRNTWRPLEARTIAEFWNRYYYWFKELLVELFFYPTFLRCFRRHDRLRIAFATFMAAGVGNVVFHFVRDIGVVGEVGLAAAIVGFQTYAFYCVVLVGGIVASQLRHRGRPRPSGRVLPALGILLFYAPLEVFDDTERTHTLLEHAGFFLNLIGWNS